MLNAGDLTREGRILEAAVASAAPDAATLATALKTATAPEHLAALAILAGRLASKDLVPPLTALLERDGAPGRAAAWALAQIGCERELLHAVEHGKLDARENGYVGLTALAARSAASAGLAAAMIAQVASEIARARSGGTGLGERACRILAVLGAKELPDLIQQVIESDRFCDRFELQRLRKAVADGGRDSDTIRDLTAPWSVVFADQIYAPPAAAPPAAASSSKLLPASGAKPAAPPTAKPGAPAAKPPAQAPQASAPRPPAMDTAEGDDGADDLADAALPAEGKPTPIDWKDFLVSPEAATLAAPIKSLVAQIGPVLEQLSVRAIQAPLTDLSGNEFAALLLQVLPQALPPQAVQAALSPHALNGYQALAKYLARTGVATAGDDLVNGVKLVRQELTAQMRQSGILGGPDYSDPDEPKV
ncbi:MAG: hypothetical protein H0V44_04965 [Planctomycetes bacterium]|nr:hypothetical protein [Planctomycetota bacterium]